MNLKLKWMAIGFHSLFLLLMMFGSFQPHKKKSHVLVQTIRVMPTTIPVQQKKEKATAASPQKSAPLPKATAPVAAKKTTPKPTVTKPKGKVSTPSPKKKPPPPSSDPVKESLLKELEEGIAKIETHKEAFRNKPSKLSSLSPLMLQIDSGDGGEENYVSSLIGYLHERLQLPELGAVKIELTLHQDGSVAKLIVLQAQSKRNKTYLEERLRLLQFPPLGKSGSQTFTLNFCNEP